MSCALGISLSRKSRPSSSFLVEWRRHAASLMQSYIWSITIGMLARLALSMKPIDSTELGRSLTSWASLQIYDNSIRTSIDCLRSDRPLPRQKTSITRSSKSQSPSTQPAIQRLTRSHISVSSNTTLQTPTISTPLTLGAARCSANTSDRRTKSFARDHQAQSAAAMALTVRPIQTGTPSKPHT